MNRKKVESSLIPKKKNFASGYNYYKFFYVLIKPSKNFAINN